MVQDILSNFIKIMNNPVSNTDLLLVNLGRSFGFDLSGYQDLKNSQEEVFTDKIREEALKRMQNQKINVLNDSYKDMFYAGSIDFMVSDEPTGRRFFLLETNGGSNRGLSILTDKQQSMKYDGYFNAINRAIENNQRSDKKILILIGIPVDDGLIHEKVLMLEYLRKKLDQLNFTVEFFTVDSFIRDFKADIAFLIADYKQLSNSLTFSDGWIKIKEHSKINVLIGDGIARRINDTDFQYLINEDFRRIKTIIINPIYKITDDKSLTYLTSFFAKDLLEKFKLKYLFFTKAFNEKELINKIKNIINIYKKPFIIKPNGGSGGAGVIPISPEQDMSKINDLIEISKTEFFNKFSKNRDPYPYTIQEMAKFSLINWKGGKHTFDIRIYLSQINGQIIPIGGLARIARGNYTGSLNKEEFVVNLSGFDGQIEVFRGKGISEGNSKLLNLEIEDFVNMFCIGSILFVNMVKNYKKIVEFSNWDQIIG